MLGSILLIAVAYFGFDAMVEASSYKRWQSVADVPAGIILDKISSVQFEVRLLLDERAQTPPVVMRLEEAITMLSNEFERYLPLLAASPLLAVVINPTVSFEQQARSVLHLARDKPEPDLELHDYRYGNTDSAYEAVRAAFSQIVHPFRMHSPDGLVVGQKTKPWHGDPSCNSLIFRPTGLRQSKTTVPSQNVPPSSGSVAQRQPAAQAQASAIGRLAKSRIMSTCSPTISKPRPPTARLSLATRASA